MCKKLYFIATIESTSESFVIPAAYVSKEKGYDVSLLCSVSDHLVKKYSKDFRLVNVKMDRGISIRDVLIRPFESYKISKYKNSDYVQYATTNASFYACIPAKLLKIKTRAYCSWGLLYVGFDDMKRTIYRSIEKIMCKIATHITVASYKNMEVAAEGGMLDKKESSIIDAGGTVGVDLSVFNFSKRGQCKFEVQRGYPVLGGKIVFGYVDRIEIDKGINELLMAFQKTNNPDFTPLMIGRFDDLRCDLGPEILKWAESNENVILHGLSCEISKYMSAMDILVHPTYREGPSMVIQQAMAMGCAIIITNAPRPSEVTEKSKSGSLVPDRTIDELSEVIQQLETDRRMREKLSAVGLERVKKYLERGKILELTYENRLKMMSNKLQLTNDSI